MHTVLLFSSAKRKQMEIFTYYKCLIPFHNS